MPTYAGMALADFDVAEVYRPNTRQNVNGTNVLYTDGFATQEQKAVLGAAGDGALFVEKKKYDTVELYFGESQYLQALLAWSQRVRVFA